MARDVNCHIFSFCAFPFLIPAIQASSQTILSTSSARAIGVLLQAAPAARQPGRQAAVKATSLILCVYLTSMPAMCRPAANRQRRHFLRRRGGRAGNRAAAAGGRPRQPGRLVAGVRGRRRAVPDRQRIFRGGCTRRAPVWRRDRGVLRAARRMGSYRSPPQRCLEVNF